MSVRFALLAVGALLLVVSGRSVRAQIIEPTLLNTFTNPTPPAASDNFGWAVAPVGGERMLVSAYRDDTGAANAGAAYLLDTNGAVLTVFTNPTPQTEDRFGWAVATLRTNRLLISATLDDTGAVNAGAVYLFTTNGLLLATVTNPAPVSSEVFGFSLAVSANNRLLVGAPNNNTAVPSGGAAYLFETNGTLQQAFLNPAPADYDFFGYAVAALGNSRVVISAPGDYVLSTNPGVVYLFATNGALLTTLTNPTPATGDEFGRSLTILPGDRLLVGAGHDDTGATDAGAAYLFSTNGALLATFNNPTPGLEEQFSYALTAVGSEWVLISAIKDGTGATGAGAAYLFDTNGVLLTTITNPAPASGDNFGFSIAALDGNRVLVGASWDNAGELDAGTAYLFNLEINPLTLNLQPTAPGYSIHWLTSVPGLILQQADALAPPDTWIDVAESVTVQGLTNLVQQTVPAAVTNRFYRLRRP